MSDYPNKSDEYYKAQLKNPVKKVPRAKLPDKFYTKHSTWIAKGIVFDVAQLRENRLSYARPVRSLGIQWLGEVFPEIVSRILAGEQFTLESFQKTEYFKYLVAQLHPVCFTKGYPWNRALRHVYVKKFQDLVNLCHSVKKNGLTAPLDMYVDGDYVVLNRGSRRLEILYQLGVKKVPVRVWRSHWLSQYFIPSQEWEKTDDSIHGLAVKQFARYQDKATDKYWVHYYTPYYDRHIGYLKNKKIKLLELGVKRGMSLKLWEEYFVNADIFGIDIDDRVKRNDRVKTVVGDECNLEFLKKFGKDNKFFDVIIDDASHIPQNQKNTMNVLWDYLHSGGIYVIEDIHASYKEKHKDTSLMPTLKDKVDSIWTNHKVKSIAFYPNIVFLEKA